MSENKHTYLLTAQRASRGDCGNYFACQFCVLNGGSGPVTVEVTSTLPPAFGRHQIDQREAQVWTNPSLNEPFEEGMRELGLKRSDARGQEAPAVRMTQKGQIYFAECEAGKTVNVTSS